MPISQKEGNLSITHQSKATTRRNVKNVDIYVTTDRLININAGGSGDINVDGVLSSENVKIKLTSSGALTAAAKASNLAVTASGSGSIKLTGNTNNITNSDENITTQIAREEHFVQGQAKKDPNAVY